ncbi:MAG TPA: hypothetical protein DDY68_02015 [Porphyromonadaceae bacterium]|nr:hypothetical protein [Porphyromonadaceae bacterium]
MKRLLIIVIVFLCFPYAECQNIAFEETEYNFKTFNEDEGEVSHTFTFKNTGEKTLILYDVVVSCGCTTPEWNQQPVPPNGTGTIKVTYNPTRRIGVFTKSIRVKSNALNGTQVLSIKGNVLEGQSSSIDLYPVKNQYMEFNTSALHLGEIGKEEQKTGWIEFVNRSSSPIDVKVENVPECFAIMVNPMHIESGNKGVIFVTFKGKQCKSKGLVSGEFILSCQGEGLPKVQQTFLVEANHLGK